MGKIIDISEFRKKNEEILKYRTEALTKGNIEVYICNSCGSEFEVINDEFPKNCPICGTEILFWK